MSGDTHSATCAELAAVRPYGVRLVHALTVMVGPRPGRPGPDPPDGRGHQLGTARCMAPEQCQAKQVTEVAGLYALGCVLYEMLVGVPPSIRERLIAHPEPCVLALRRVETAVEE